MNSYFYNNESAATDSTNEHIFFNGTSGSVQDRVHKYCCKCLNDKGFLFWWANNWYHFGCLPSKNGKHLLSDLRLPRESFVRRLSPTVATLNYRPRYHRSHNPSIVRSE